MAALSLAGNIIQFVDFGTRLLLRAGELYKSSIGSLAIHDEIELITTDLQVLITKLRDAFSTRGSTNLQTLVHGNTLANFEKICDEAAKIAEELKERLASLRTGGKLNKLRSLQQAVKTMWSEKEVLALAERLSSFKAALETRVLFSIWFDSPHTAILHN